MKFLVLIFVLTILGALTLAEDLFAKDFHKASEGNNNVFNNNFNNFPAMADDKDEKPAEGAPGPPQRHCKPAICSRIYRPVCGLVDGIPLTAPSMCHFKDKERCYREILDEGEKMPVFRFLHDGPCTDADPNILKGVSNKRRPGRPGNQRRPNNNIRRKNF